MPDVDGGEQPGEEGVIGRALEVIPDDPGSVRHNVDDQKASMPSPVEAGVQLHTSPSAGMGGLRGQWHQDSIHEGEITSEVWAA